MNGQYLFRKNMNVLTPFAMVLPAFRSAFLKARVSSCFFLVRRYLNFHSMIFFTGFDPAFWKIRTGIDHSGGPPDALLNLKGYFIKHCRLTPLLFQSATPPRSVSNQNTDKAFLQPHAKFQFCLLVRDDYNNQVCSPRFSSFF
jgi:hypothetical protein